MSRRRCSHFALLRPLHLSTCDRIKLASLSVCRIAVSPARQLEVVNDKQLASEMIHLESYLAIIFRKIKLTKVPQGSDEAGERLQVWKSRRWMTTCH